MGATTPTHTGLEPALRLLIDPPSVPNGVIAGAFGVMALVRFVWVRTVCKGELGESPARRRLIVTGAGNIGTRVGV